MDRGRWAILFLLVAIGTGVLFWPFRDEKPWRREHPLINPIRVQSVLDGVVMLADGRSYRPGGIHRREAVPIKEHDQFLRAVTAQGVTILRDLGDGEALMLAEPKFFVGCPTCKRRGGPGSYFRCPLSEFLIYAEYADAETTGPNLSPLEQWRLDGAEQLRVAGRDWLRLNGDGSAVRFDSNVHYWYEYDEMLSRMWTPPPTERIDGAG